MSNEIDCLVGENLLSMKSFVNAMKSYKKRFYSLPGPIGNIQIQFVSIKPTGKLWQDSHIFSAMIFKQGLSRAIVERGGEYVLFYSTHKIRR